MSQKTAIAIVAHPDDIEFQMGGTLLRLKAAGWDVHYFNLCNGCGGSVEHGAKEIAAIRLEEAKRAAEILGATWHPPICNDLEVFYNKELLSKVAATIREVQPDIVLTHALADYMEDHMNTGRLATTAAFAHGVPNFESDPPRAAYFKDVTVYHCMPHGARDPLRRRVSPGAWVDTTEFHQTAMEALKAHQSQQGWLDSSQGMSNYLTNLEERSLKMGELSGKFKYADGWTRHLHLGFSTSEIDPLADALGDHYLINQEFENSL